MVGPTQQGLLAVLVARGDEVAAGVSLFAQDDADDRAARDQAAQAARQLVNLEEGGKPTEIEQVTANLADAHATLLRTVADLGRGEALLPKGDATKPSVDQLRADQLSAQAKVESLQAALAQSRAPMGREGEIPAQRAAVAASRAALAMAGFVRPLAMRSGEAARFTQSTGFRLTCISMSCCPATGGSPQASSPFWCTAKRPHNSGWQAWHPYRDADAAWDIRSVGDANRPYGGFDEDNAPAHRWRVAGALAPALIAKLKTKGIRKFVAFDIPLELAKQRYANHFVVVAHDLHEADDLRVLDFDGQHAF
jgi:hypothetical protein